MIVVVPSAVLHILSNLRVSLLRAAEIAGLQILAQGLEILFQLCQLRLRAGRRGGQCRSCGGCGSRSRRQSVLRESDKILLGCRDIAAFQIGAELLEVSEKLLSAGKQRVEL